MVATGGILFGPFWGFVYAWIGRHGGDDRGLPPRAPHRTGVGAACAASPVPAPARARPPAAPHGFALVAVLRVILFLAPPLSWALGASRVRLVDHVLGTAVGILPMIVLAVVFAHRLGAAGSIRRSFRGGGPAAGGALVLLILLGLVLGRRLLEPSAAGRRAESARSRGRRARVRSKVASMRRRRTAPREAEQSGQPFRPARAARRPASRWSRSVTPRARFASRLPSAATTSGTCAKRGGVPPRSRASSA